MSLFDHIASEQILLDPYPHLIQENLLDEALCESLIKSRPAPELAATKSGSGQKLYFRAAQINANKAMSPVWRQFIAEQLQESNIRDLLQCFAPVIRKQYPNLESAFKRPLEEFRIGQRFIDSADEFDVLVEAQLTYHVFTGSFPRQERGPHVKSTNKLLNCEFMLRLFEDDSSGGDFEMYLPVADAFLAYAIDQQVRNCKSVELKKVIPYKANTAITCLNSPYSFQAMAARGATTFPVMFFNLVVECKKPLFSLLSSTKTTQKVFS